ncbi:MAG: NAD-dependent epimerase/dehydratase family protein [Stellaceae bacterium]
MRVAVIGATGILGRHLIPRLIERGHRVSAIARSAAKRAQLERLGVAASEGDILDRASLGSALAGADIAVHAVTVIPPAGPNPDWSPNDRVRREGTDNLIAACRDGGVRRYVQQSIAHVVAADSDLVLDEDASMHPTRITQSAVDMETRVRQSGLDWIIVRGGLFYGPGTGRERQWRAAARTGTLLLPGDGSAFIALVHVADMAAACVLAAERGAPGALLAAVDDESVRYANLFGCIAALEDGPAPQPGGPAVPSCRIANARIKAALGWTPLYPTYRSGLA